MVSKEAEKAEMERLAELKAKRKMGIGLSSSSF